MNNKDEISTYLTCERRWVFELLMLCAGMMGAYTFVLRGGVFCNAQTANFVMMAVELGQGHWMKGIYYLIPATAYCAGALISEVLPTPVKRMRVFRWDTYLIGFEMIVLIILGFIPVSAPHQITQVSINFIASMQYNTFRQAEGIPMATTFCTNHLRQLGIGIAKYIRKRDTLALRKGLKHLKMIVYFFAGGVMMSYLCGRIVEKAIWMAAVPLLIIFSMLAYADLVSERDKLEEKPHGH
jgi:uncharacterized membrane protein YoaK (UPF0700 family)